MLLIIHSSFARVEHGIEYHGTFWREMSTLSNRRAAFRALIDSGRTILVPGAPKALTARLIEDSGSEACYITGAGLSNTYLGMSESQ